MSWYKKAQNNNQPIEFDSSEGIHEIKIDHATIIYQVLSNKEVILSSLRVPRQYIRHGFAKQILSKFVKWLDDEGLFSTLGASPLDKRTSPLMLEKLYSEFGYNPTGKYINPVFDKEMKREPENNDLV